MSILNYFKESFRRKKARRVTQVYPSKIETFQLKDEGTIQFANWDNPLVERKIVSQEMVDFFKKFIKKGDLVIDIGANIGDTTVPMAIAAGAEGTTLGFDPNPYVFAVLKENAALNPGKQNIVPLLNAISVEDEEFYYISSEASFANGAISLGKESIHGNFVHSEKIKGVNLLRFLEANYKDQLPKFSFMKIDTEGYDKEIIKSCSDLIAQYKPVIVAESFGNSSRDEKIELYEVIARHGYDIFYFADFDINAEVVAIENKYDIANWTKTINIYAVPK